MCVLAWPSAARITLASNLRQAVGREVDDGADDHHAEERKGDDRLRAATTRGKSDTTKWASKHGTWASEHSDAREQRDGGGPRMWRGWHRLRGCARSI